jgi:hypothetical protein
MQLFFSYARPDRLRVDSLVTRLRQAGIEIWLDSDLVGGWPWWDKILGQLRSCDAVLASVSRASANSQACRAEREYAAKLGKPILPIAVEHMPAGLFPADIARLQIIDYTQPDEAAAFRLATAIFAMPKPKPLPSPLPPPPGLPQTRFSNLNDRIVAPSLSLEEQLGIIVLLEGALGPTSDQEDRETAAEMLSEMAKRPDLYEAAARKIQALQAQARSAEPGTSQGPSPSTPPPSAVPPSAVPPTTPPPSAAPSGPSPQKSARSTDPWPWSQQATSTAPQQSQATSAKPLFTEPQQSQPTGTKPLWPEPEQSQPYSAKPLFTQPQQSQPTGTKPLFTEPQQSQPTSTLPPQSQSSQSQSPQSQSPQSQSPQSQSPPSPAAPSAGVVKAHRAMAIVAAIITVPTVILAPIGIMALIYSNQAKTNSSLGNTMGARKASARVLAAFWIAIAIWIIIGGIVIAGSAGAGSGYSSAIAVSHSVLP